MPPADFGEATVSSGVSSKSGQFGSYFAQIVDELLHSKAGQRRMLAGIEWTFVHPG
jgi:hypothetical protein